jgi:cell wall-associated NlpC family hydrolase
MWWNDYIGVPFTERGRSREGFDCWGLAMQIYRDRLGVELPDYQHLYEHTAREARKIAGIIETEKDNGWLEVPLNKAQPFDIIIFRQGGLHCHVGIITMPKHFIHATKGIGVAHEKYNSAKWADVFHGLRRWKNL